MPDVFSAGEDDERQGYRWSDPLLREPDSIGGQMKQRGNRSIEFGFVGDG